MKNYLEFNTMQDMIKCINKAVKMGYKFENVEEKKDFTKLVPLHYFALDYIANFPERTKNMKVVRVEGGTSNQNSTIYGELPNGEYAEVTGEFELVETNTTVYLTHDYLSADGTWYELRRYI